MRADDAGAGSALAVAVIAVTVLAGLVGLQVAAATHTRHLAMVAADLSALAAASVVVGIVPGSPCDAATATAARDGATAVRCDVSGTTATVVVRVDGALGPAQATAVAGAAP